jgi:elongation factor Ts
MAEISAEMVRELREATNVSMMECKRALVEAGGDKDKAMRLLRERGMAIAAKKATRTANQGLVASAITEGGRCGSLIEVNCETDFVAKNDGFQAFVKTLAAKAATLDGSLADVCRAEVTAKVAELGENIVARRNLRYVLQGKGAVVSYIHLGGKVGVLLELGCDNDATVQSPVFVELGKDITMHIAACSPRYLHREDVPADVVKAEREIYAKQVTGKPANIIDKIVDGKIGKFYKEACLVEQGFVKDPDTSITKLLEAKGKELGDKLVILRFTRFQLGE